VSRDEIQLTQEVSDPAQTHNALWRELVAIIIEWEDSFESAGDLARRIIQVIGKGEKLGS
jgi:hypothetical protein